MCRIAWPPMIRPYFRQGGHVGASEWTLLAAQAR
jgi:hypothetical protein